MLQRDKIMSEFWHRISHVEGVSWTARNPSAPPGAENMPAIQIFELSDTVTERTMRGGYPAYKRVMRVVMEIFIKGTSEGASSSELFAFLEKVKKAMYQGGPSLGGLCEFSEVGSDRMLRPPAGQHIIGIGLEIEIAYVENTATLFS